MRLSLKKTYLNTTRRCKRIASMTTLLAVVGTLVIVSGCASSSSDGAQRPSVERPGTANKILACKNTDRQISSSNQCLQDDAACYQISNGQWCTGERGNTCPSGSTPIAAGASCPAGARCFRYSESLECMI